MSFSPKQDSSHWCLEQTLAYAVDDLCLPAQADRVPNPRMIAWNELLAAEMGLDLPNDEAGAQIFSGNRLPAGAEPSAQAYAGHQFGNFVPLLGDGRALLLGEVVDRYGKRRDIQLKGAGRTPFSRGGDGKAALGPVLREYLVSEAMHALGIPTTRALAAVTTGETLWRQGEVPGAILTRVATSHIRVGTFEFLAARGGDAVRLKQLADYVINRHYPALKDSVSPYIELLAAVVDAQANLVARWMSIGFVHGVMNTDNTSIAGETIDYGPCAFMDAYHPKTVFSSIDLQGRYAYGNQPNIARWNLARFAETLLPLIDTDGDAAIAQANTVLADFPGRYARHWLAAMRPKLGLSSDTGVSDSADTELIHWLLTAMQSERVDFTQGFRQLSTAVRGNSEPLRSLFNGSADFADWLERWNTRVAQEKRTADARAERMDAVNPVIIPRNHQVEAMIEAAVREGDFAPFHALLAAVTHPFENRPEWQKYAEPAPASFGPFTTFCGT
ncbi:YdiU family protein [Halothiobacillus sp.]|uniref:protein adenylyltransferase SelO n=1 Tax=Halothiobacillus sp. TaxID=1891311 RepID=UPI0026016BD3|nr:YdiU family protein [Halothiobacillus sp.]MDD4966278.1 YdiU family protein [Halothiobacillus sp.]